MGPGAGLDRCGKSRSTGIRSPEFPARSESHTDYAIPAPWYKRRARKVCSTQVGFTSCATVVSLQNTTAQGLGERQRV